MGVAGAICHLCVFRMLPLGVVFLAVFVGWLNSQAVPAATLIATVFPLMGGYRPPTIFGSFWTPATIAVPDDMTPEARPAGERFLQMPGGYQMPASGLGMCCRPSAYDPETVRRTVLWYLLQGGRHIDDADLYWNHQAVGTGIREAMARGVPRSEVFLTTKLAPSFFGKEMAKTSVKRFLEELGLDYIDLVLLHAPTCMYGKFGECRGKEWKDCRAETWLALSELRDQGLVRNIGVSNFAVHHMQQIRALSAAPIATNQIEFHPWVADWQQEAFEYCNQNGIALTAYYSMGGFLGKAATETVNTIKEIGATRGVSTQQLMLRWALQKNVSVIPGTSNPKHMRENLDVYKWELSADEMARLDALRSDPNRLTFFAPPMDPN